MARKTAGQQHVAAFCLCIAATAGLVMGQDITIDPSSNHLVLPEGETLEETLLVTVPADAGVSNVDVYLLADTTGSMGSIISAVRSGAAQIVDGLASSLPDVDLRFGVGDYKDFPGLLAFQSQVAITDDADAITSAIAQWSASGGGDGSEGQFFALDRLAANVGPDGNPIGFRPNAERIVVWFGDAPGHDPICTGISGLAEDITEASLIEKLQQAGLAVVAISTTTGYPQALNDDPGVSATDYLAHCDVGGSAGQADRIAAATGGSSVVGITPATIVDTITSLIEAQVSTIQVLRLRASGETAPFVVSITPRDGYGPIDTAETSVFDFSVAFLGVEPCIEDSAQLFGGTIDVVADDSVEAQKDVTITVPACAATTGACCVSEPDPSCEHDTGFTLFPRRDDDSSDEDHDSGDDDSDDHGSDDDHDSEDDGGDDDSSSDDHGSDDGSDDDSSSDDHGSDDGSDDDSSDDDDDSGGACPDVSVCLETSAEECAAAGGIYAGDSSRCLPGPACDVSICGDGTVDPPLESCDDGNTIPGDGCDGTCALEFCGDGVINNAGSEACDDGNTLPGDGCDADCQLEAFCGDGVIDSPTEECDDGNVLSGDGCTAECQDEFCGDGVVNDNDEGCDDGNTVPGDGCDASCMVEGVCGDGVINPDSEECDDGNLAPDDGCDGGCRLEYCGDGVTNNGAETCDDGNTTAGDGCDASCMLEFVGQIVEFDGPDPIDPTILAELPLNDAGQPVLIELQGLQLVIEDSPPDADAGLARCATWISTCQSPPDRTLDDCARSVPLCETDTPWLEGAACCPAACFQVYEMQRLGGTDPFAAYTEVYHLDASCFPGATGLRELQQEDAR